MGDKQNNSANSAPVEVKKVRFLLKRKKI